jgi:hypothetical protein
MAGEGSLSKLAIVKGATWGTAATLSTGNRAPFVSKSLKARREAIPDESILGHPLRAISRNGSRVVEGDIVVQADYRQVGGLLQDALFLGSAGAPAAVETGVKLHTLKLADTVTGLFATCGIDLGGVKVEGFNSIKCVRRSLSLRAGDAMKVTYGYVGRGFDDTISSSAWTFATDPQGDGQQQVLMSHAVLRINAQSGGALGSGDVCYPVEIGIEMSRPLGVEYGQSPDPEEPLPSGWGEVAISLTFYRCTSALYDLLRAAHLQETNLKMDLVFSWPVLLGATKYPQWALYFPMLRCIEVPLDIPNPGKVPFSARFTAHDAGSTAPTGFTSGFTNAVVETRQIALTTDILA